MKILEKLQAQVRGEKVKKKEDSLIRRMKKKKTKENWDLRYINEISPEEWREWEEAHGGK